MLLRFVYLILLTLYFLNGNAQNKNIEGFYTGSYVTFNPTSISKDILQIKYLNRKQFTFKSKHISKFKVNYKWVNDSLILKPLDTLYTAKYNAKTKFLHLTYKSEEKTFRFNGALDFIDQKDLELKREKNKDRHKLNKQNREKKVLYSKYVGTLFNYKTDDSNVDTLSIYVFSQQDFQNDKLYNNYLQVLSGARLFSIFEVPYQYDFENKKYQNLDQSQNIIFTIHLDQKTIKLEDKSRFFKFEGKAIN